MPVAQIKDLSVSFLSLVEKPATGKRLTLKGLTLNDPGRDGARLQTFDLVIRHDEMMRAYGIVYAPDQEDAHGDTADAVTIRRAATEFMRDGRLNNIDVDHSFSTEAAFVAESWLVRKGDALFATEPEGAWAVGIQIGDPDLWRQLKSGALTGISLAGTARLSPGPETFTEKTAGETAGAAAPGWVERLIRALSGGKDTIEETEMDKTQVQEIVHDMLAGELGDAITRALKAAGITTGITNRQAAGDTSRNRIEQARIEQAVSAALKTAGLAPADGGADGAAADRGQTGSDTAGAATADTDESTIETAIATGIVRALKPFEARLEDKIARALARGVTETGADTGSAEESFI